MSFYRPENTDLKKKYEEKLREKKGHKKDNSHEAGKKGTYQEKKRDYEGKEGAEGGIRRGGGGLVVENKKGSLAISAALIGAFLMAGFIFLKVKL